MGREIVYCSGCGDRILASEFDRGHAGTAGGKDFCRKCMKAGSGKAEDAEEPCESNPPPGRRTPRKPIKRPPGPPGTTRIPFAAKEGTPERKPARDSGRRTLLIVGVVVLAVLLALVIVVLTKRPGE